MADAGRGVAAADTYLRACEGASESQVLELKRLAAIQLLGAGRLEQARELLAEVLRTFDIRLPATAAQAVVTLMFERARIKLRGLELSAGQVDPERKQQRHCTGWWCA